MVAQNHAFGAANEQVILQHVTQPSQSVAHRRLTQTKAAAGPRDASFLHDGVEDDEQVQVECTQFHAGRNQWKSLLNLAKFFTRM